MVSAGPSATSITQVAKLAGVSTATVSRVLNERHVVSEATTAKVQEVIRRTGYRSPPPGSRRGPKAHLHARLQHGSIAFLWTSSVKAMHEVPPAEAPAGGFSWLGGIEPAQTLTGHAMLQGAASALRKHRISVAIDYLYDSSRLPAILEDRKVDGLLLHGPEPEESIAGKLRQFRAVWLLYAGASTWGDRVQPDHRAVGRKAVDYFATSKCRQVCCITYRPAWPNTRYHTERADAFEQHARLRRIPAITLGTEFEEPRDNRNFNELAEMIVDQFVKLNPRPDGLFVANDLGYYVHQHLCQRGVIPMKDVLYVCGDREVVYQRMDPEPIKVDIHSYEIGRMAVEVLIMRLANLDAPRITQMIEPTLV